MKEDAWTPGPTSRTSRTASRTQDGMDSKRDERSSGTEKEGLLGFRSQLPRNSRLQGQITGWKGFESRWHW
ncbi:hypothetical protein B9Z55_013474 [Caenorhabditis nigoni]|uniref:Uncharacterized protein n=1 Tax=Caenorhabditis nigoni TaxID=1611254 RepID=A0A2G5U242_9PELO|nr:hypothetical protein B9Z55_013474 [Caenorhabditis nigoni]